MSTLKRWAKSIGRFVPVAVLLVTAASLVFLGYATNLATALNIPVFGHSHTRDGIQEIIRLAEDPKNNYKFSDRRDDPSLGNKSIAFTLNGDKYLIFYRLTDDGEFIKDITFSVCSKGVKRTVTDTFLDGTANIGHSCPIVGIDKEFDDASWASKTKLSVRSRGTEHAGYWQDQLDTDVITVLGYLRDPSSSTDLTASNCGR